MSIQAKVEAPSARAKGHLYIEITHQPPSGLFQGEDPDPWWRADVMVQGVFGMDRKSIAHGFGKRDKGADVDDKGAQGDAAAKAWHEVWKSVEVVRP